MLKNHLCHTVERKTLLAFTLAILSLSLLSESVIADSRIPAVNDNLVPVIVSDGFVPITSYGQVVDSITFGGHTVNAIYRPYESSVDIDSTYSCAAFVVRFYSEVYGISVTNMWGPAYVPNASSGSFSETASPTVGDIVRFNNETHWAIVKAIDGTAITLIQQNAWDSTRTAAQVNRVIDSSSNAYSFFRYSGAGSVVTHTIIANGDCGGEGDGTNLWWTLDSEGLLTIGGEGKMANYDTYGSLIAPWHSYQFTLEKVAIGSRVTTIGSYAFHDCWALSNVTIPNGVTSIDEGAFYNCGGLADIAIPQSVTNIGNDAFYHCSSLVEIYIPTSVTRIGNYAFERCNSLTKITVSGNNPSYSSDNFGVLFDKAKQTLLQYPIANGRKSYTIPPSVVSIHAGAFRDCDNLTDITIPNSVTEIGSDAFSFSGITSIMIPEGIENLDYRTFEYCESLTRVDLPLTLKGISSNAFYACTALGTVYYNGTKEQWGEVFIDSGNDAIKNALIHFNTVPSPGKSYVAVRRTRIPVGGTTQAYLNDASHSISRMLWSSSNRSVATVDANGRVTGIAPGLTYLTAVTDKGSCFSCSVAVVEKDRSSYLDSYAYSFPNNSESFGYPESYRIPMERYVQAGHGLAAAKLYYDVLKTKWDGNCHGMSASSILFYKGVLQEEYYDSQVHYPYDFKQPNTYARGDLDLRNMIELFQASQSPFNNGSVHNLFNTAIGRSIANELDKGNPVLLALKCSAGGHSVVAYDYSYNDDDGIYTFDIYDCSGFISQFRCKDGISFPSEFVYLDHKYDFSFLNYQTVSDLTGVYNQIRNCLLYPSTYLSPPMKLMGSVREAPIYVALTKNAAIINSAEQASVLENGELTGEIENAYANISDISSEKTMYYLTLPADDYHFNFSETEAGEIIIFDGSSILSAELSDITALSVDRKLTSVSLQAKGEAAYELTSRPGNSDSYDKLTLSGTMETQLTADLSDVTTVTVSGAETLEAVLTVSESDVSVSAENLQKAEATVQIAQEEASIYIGDTVVSGVQLSDRKKLPLPAYDLESGSYQEAQTLKFVKDDATVIYFTTDGKDPSAESGMVYGNPITVSKSMTIKAIAVKPGYEDSDILMLSYDVADVQAPTASMTSGSYDQALYVALTSNTADADIFYTLDGSDPHIDGICYSGALYIDEDTTLRAFSCLNGCVSNDIVLNYCVTVGNPLAIINAPVDQFGKAISAESPTDVTQIKLVVKNYSEADKVCTVALCFYDGSNRMLKFISSDALVEIGESEISVEIGTIPVDTARMKVFLFDSEYKPLGACFSNIL